MNKTNSKESVFGFKEKMNSDLSRKIIFKIIRFYYHFRKKDRKTITINQAEKILIVAGV